MTFSEQDVSKIIANINKARDRDWYRGFVWGVVAGITGMVLGAIVVFFGF